MNTIMRISVILIILASCVVISCAKKENPQLHPTDSQDIHVPPLADESATVDVSALDTLSGFSQLPSIEKEILRKTVQRQIVHYEKLKHWADMANTIKTGREASVAMRMYLSYLGDFEKKMKELDAEYSGKLPENYAESDRFSSVLDAYFDSVELQEQADYILNSFVSLMQRFHDDPECRDVFTELQNMVNQSE